MYKTKVQELCHQKRWSLPRYSTMKDGADHDPRFKSSVSVNGLSFHSSVSCKSSKESQNDAAKLAFLHFTSPPPNITRKNNRKIAHLDFPYIHLVPNVQCRYKSVLQNYARRKNLDSPLYSSIREGPAHACSFKARVTIDGHTFESLEFFKNLKQAEHAAAKVALFSLACDDFQEDDGVFYKNVLHELSLREGLPVPLYETIKCGAPHMPTFISMVEVDGEVFYGKAGRTKKKAEMKAAKVAYTALIERGRSCSIGSITHTVKADGVPNSTLSSDLDPCFDVPPSPKRCLSSSLPMTELDVSALSISDSMAAKRATVTSSYLLCNRVRVYTRIPDIAFPKGITLMPISEDKWVAVSLEFPNEEGN
ncbi:hypothetical protein CICLE_v10018273mg [Citrus x clementina]|uniref:DRBM domain-containing protein n=1 Tax=Citrus clementina TaxID=85681 RepID=V4U6H1_CITCL|nr:hypothetical protein CICLE_v10018273mg [Citrus x clementina]